MKSLVRVIILLCISTSGLFAQNARIDSLKQKLASTPESESFEINFQLAREFAKIDNKIALDFAIKAKTSAYLKPDSLNIVKSLRILGQLFRRLDQLDSSILYFLKGLPVASRNNFDEELNSLLNGLSVAYIFNSKYDLALFYLLQCAPLYEKSGDKSMNGAYENNLGLVYYKLNDYKTALEHYNKSLSIKLAIRDNFNMEALLINISLCKAKLGNLEEAKKEIKYVLDNCVTNCDDDIIVMAKYTSGVIWKELKNLNKAEKDFLQSYAIAKKSNNQRSTFDNIIDLSEIYLKQKKLRLAEKFLLEGEKMTATSSFDLEEMKLYEQICALYKDKGNYRKLSFYQEKYIQMKDDIYTQEKANNLMYFHAESAEKVNKAQLASQEQTLQLKDEIINKQLGINILIGIVIALLAILIYILIKILLQRKEANTLLNKKVVERSDELLRNYEKLSLALAQRDLALTKLNSDFSHSIESMRSLCLAGTKTEMDVHAQRYFNEIDITTLNLSHSLSNILTESKVA